MSQQFCTFKLDGHLFGVEVLHVQEVIRFQEMTRVPLAPGAVNGLINLRGQIVTAIDLRARFGMASRRPNQLPMNVIIRTDDGAVSFLVDEIGDVFDVGDDALESPPQTIDGEARELIRGVYKLNDGLLLALDTERACDTGRLVGAAVED
ncbi:MAG: chemotaxis protein CheW [Candidatus Eisenbacteria bacterium]|uniref:Purine-binding chemotaxis protein CheW n=1 Tax=Eiseniibacteriota bacterium TaxID=2212470 RepID=A0A956LVT0_UNCEI|nr:purine-binding chemotaxis protein CheW [Candidatus Eisenbacteria bacterium]